MVGGPAENCPGTYSHLSAPLTAPTTLLNLLGVHFIDVSMIPLPWLTMKPCGTQPDVQWLQMAREGLRFTGKEQLAPLWNVVMARRALLCETGRNMKLWFVKWLTMLSRMCVSLRW